MRVAVMETYGGVVRRGEAGDLERRASGRAWALRRSLLGAARRAEDGATRSAKGLGWLSIGLGLSSLLSPGRFARMSGLPDDRRTRTASRMRAAREIACGIGILVRPHAPAWLWARVVGDLVDLALLGRALGFRRANRPKVLQSMASVAGVLVLDALTATQLGRGGARARVVGGRRARCGSVRVSRSITVNRAPDEVYRFWRDLQNLPLFMDHLDSVDVVDGESHWRARGANGEVLAWDAALIEDRPNELLAWKSVAGADVDAAAIVELTPAPGERGTTVRLDLRYEPTKRRFGALLAGMFGADPRGAVEADLRRFKQVLETGEVVHSDASIHRGRHAARPPSNEEMSR